MVGSHMEYGVVLVLLFSKHMAPDSIKNCPPQLFKFVPYLEDDSKLG